MQENTAKVRDSMSKMTDRVRKAVRFNVDETLAVKIPRKDRLCTDPTPLFCVIVKKPHPDRYQLQSPYGVLKRHYPTRELEPVQSTIPSGVNSDSPKAVVALATAVSRWIRET